MYSTMTEAELFNILLGYADLATSRFEFFIGGTMAMMATIFITSAKLNVYLRSIIIILYSGFTYAQIDAMNAFNSRMGQVIDSLRTITSDQIDIIPLTQAAIGNPLISSFGVNISPSGITAILAWAGCVLLMAFPKVVKNN